MQQVTDVRSMRKADARTIAGGVSGRELMGRAARGIFESCAWQGPVAVVCGVGNNAGDGYALACLLSEAGIPCTVFRLSRTLTADSGYFCEKCREIGVEICDFTENTALCSYREVVDCIFGTGFHGEVQGAFGTAIDAINQSGAFVVSADINSGLCGDSGIGTRCVHSDLTVSIGTLKAGVLLGDAADVIGQLTNVDIGIEIPDVHRYLTENGDFDAVLADRRHNSHKGTYGYVTILGGCREYAGAVKLANLSCAALRSGCGVAKLAVPEGIADAVAPQLLESTLALLPDREGHAHFDPAALDRILAGQAALAVGMGWGRSEENADILRYILQKCEIPVVIDADGLNTLAQMGTEVLAKTRCRVVLTPHPKEMERISGIPVSSLLQDPVGHAERFAREHGVILLLKGTCTVVTDGRVTYLCNRGCAGMATAGSGDVLSGVLVGLLGYAPCDALTVACGAHLTGLAGELAERRIGAISQLASDTVGQIAEAIRLMKTK